MEHLLGGAVRRGALDPAALAAALAANDDGFDDAWNEELVRAGWRWGLGNIAERMAGAQYMCTLRCMYLALSLAMLACKCQPLAPLTVSATPPCPPTGGGAAPAGPAGQGRRCGRHRCLPGRSTGKH